MNKGELLSIHSHEPTLGDILLKLLGGIIMTFSMRRVSAILEKKYKILRQIHKCC